MGTSIDDRLAVHATCISNDFLDQYMASANGDYIKVYLFMLRHRGEKFSVKDAADALNLTDNDIQRAVRYWEKQGVFSNGAGKCVEDEIETEAELQASEEALDRAASVQQEQKETAAEVSGTEKKKTRKSSLENVQDDEEFAGILFVAKHVLPSLPTGQQIDTLSYMYQDLEMNAELIEFLLEYCAGIEKTSSKYLAKVAIDWHESGIRTVKQAQKKIRDFEEKKTRGRKSSKPNKFLNFQQEEVDYDRIAQKKVMERIQNGAD